MNLAAYVQIPDLQGVLKENGIEIPRLRGLSLMSEAEPWTIDDKFVENLKLNCIENLCTAIPFWNPNSNMAEYSSRTNYLVSHYTDGGEPRWDRIHGWKRRTLKTYIHNELMKHKKQIAIHNKYVGREDVIYIHARIGGDNWSYFGGAEISRQPWFIEKVDDAYDSTYCDIYAKIGV